MYRPSRQLAALLFLPGLAYEGLVRLRNQFYSSRVLPSRRLTNGVISIGNITLGGSGKTPLAIYICQLIRKMGGSPALLSRGYGRSDARRILILSPQDADSAGAQSLGDEALLIRRHVPGIWLGLARDRLAAAEKILALQKDAVFVLDDGFQHRQLGRTLDLVVLDRTQPLFNNRIFPRGSLREPLTALSRADALVVHGCGVDVEPDEFEIRLVEFLPEARIFHCVHKMDDLIPLAAWRKSGAPEAVAKKPTSVFLVAAIGNPVRFRYDAAMLTPDVRGAHFYRDHYCLRDSDWRACISEASSRGAEAIMTTEKDAVKMTGEPEFPVFVAVQSIVFREQDVFEKMIHDSMKERL